LFIKYLHVIICLEGGLLKITFGLITDGKNDSRIFQIVESIKALNIEFFEILIVGSSGINLEKVKVIEFTESPSGAWITRKKNLITSAAKYEIIVYLHDYFIFDKDWFKEFSKTDDFDVAMCVIKSPGNVRYRDWTLWPHNGNLMDLFVLGHRCLIPYSISHLKEFMYVSGGFWIADKQFMLKHPLDESIFAGQSEDVEWSMRMRGSAKFLVNSRAIVYSLKDNPRVMRETGAILNAIFWLAQNKYFKSILKIKISPKVMYSFNLSHQWLSRLLKFQFITKLYSRIISVFIKL